MRENEPSRPHTLSRVVATCCDRNVAGLTHFWEKNLFYDLGNFLIGQVGAVVGKRQPSVVSAKP